MAKFKIKVTSHGIRESLGMSQSEFATTFCIPVNTVRNWDSKSCMPYYVFRLFNLVIDFVPREYLEQMYKCEKEIDVIVKKADIH